VAIVPAQGHVARGTLLNIIGHGVPLLVGALTIPAILRRTGDETFGLLALIWAALGYFGIFDFGLSRSTAWLVADAIGKGEDRSVRRIVGTSVTLHLLVGGAAGAVLAAATPAIVGGVFHVRPSLFEDARASFYVLSASVPVVVAAGAYRGLLEAYRRFDLVNVVKLIAGAMTFALPLGVVLLGGNLTAITLALAIVRAGAVIAYVQLCARMVGPVAPTTVLSRRTAASLFSFGRWILLSSLLSPILVYLDRVLIANLISVAAVAYYSAPYEMVYRLAIVPASLAMAISPTVTVMGEGRRDEIVRLSERSVRVTLLIMTPVALLLAAFARPILALWLGPDFARESAGVLQVLVLGMLANALAHVPYAVLQGLGRPDLTVKLQLVELPMYALGAWYLTWTAGITGAAVAWSVLLVVEAVVYFVLAGSVLSRSRPALREAAGRLRPAALLAGAFAGVIGLLSLMVPALAWKAALAVLATAVSGWLGWTRVLEGRDRDAIRAALRLAPQGPGR
jgi:O-antigen/teichoic acid export membrane protein